MTRRILIVVVEERDTVPPPRPPTPFKTPKPLPAPQKIATVVELRPAA